MIEGVRSWLTAIVATALLIAVAGMLTPAGTIRKIASLTGGLILLLVLLQPITHIQLGELRWDYWDYADEIARRQEELERAQEDELAGLIAEQTESYILERAQDMGIECTVHVTTKDGEDGVPYPYGVALSCGKSEELAGVMEIELGIPRERQSWHEGKAGEV